MCKQLFPFTILLFFITFSSAQRSINAKQMIFFATPKPNTIIFNDTLYNGSTAYKQLFLRTNDKVLIELYKRSQTNKIVGSAMGTIGSLALTAGVIYASSNHPNISRGTGWAIAGTGLVTAITGGYLLTRATSNLVLATYLFNKKYTSSKTTLEFSGNALTFVVKL